MSCHHALSLLLFCALAAASARAQQPAEPPSATPSGEDPVIARVLGESITEKQVLQAINQMAARQRLPEAQAKEKDIRFFRDALDNLVVQILLRSEGREKNLTVQPAKTDQYISNIRARFPSEEQFRQALAQQGMTEAEMRRSVEQNILLEQVVELAVKDVPAATDEQIQRFYDENPKYFEQPEKVHAAHILLRVEAKATPEEKEAVRTRLEGIRADIEAKKATFNEAAAKHSQDPGSAQKGGDLGFFPRGQMVKPFEEAAFNATPGSMTPVTETQFGYHLIQVIEKRPAGKSPLEESKADIRSFLERQSKQQALQQHIAELKAKSPVETVMSDQEWNSRHAPK